MVNNKEVTLGPVKRPPDGMVHCPDCGEYLGDYVNGVLYKFGRIVTEPHTCNRIKSGLDSCLDIAVSSTEGMGWSISRDWADELVSRFGLELECRNGDMSGEVSALFLYKGETLRLKLSFPNHWRIFRGDWKPDPHWAGD